MGLAETIEAVELADVQTKPTKCKTYTLEQARWSIRAAHESSIEREVMYAEKLFQGVEKLRAAGFDVDPWPTGIFYMKAKVTDLTKIRRALGKLSVLSKHPIDHGDQYTGQQMVEVTLEVAGYPSIRVEYDTPYRGEGKCKIVEHVYKSRSLVCSL